MVSEPIDFGGTGNSDTVNDYLREAQRYSTLDAKSILEQRVQEENELEEKAQRINEEHFRKQQKKKRPNAWRAKRKSAGWRPKRPNVKDRRPKSGLESLKKSAAHVKRLSVLRLNALNAKG